MAYVRQHPNYPKYRRKVGVMPDFSGANVVDQEKPSGVMNGVNKKFRLTHIPLRHSDQVFKDGMMMARASNRMFEDGDYYINYTDSPAIIEFSDRQIPQEKSIIRVNYKYMRTS